MGKEETNYAFSDHNGSLLRAAWSYDRWADRQEQDCATGSLSSCICVLQVGDQDAIVADFKRVEGEKQDVVQQQNMMRGSLATIRDGVHRAQRDLASPNYRDIDMRYRKQLIELKTTEMANSDLDKYHKVGISDCFSWSNTDCC